MWLERSAAHPHQREFREGVLTIHLEVVRPDCYILAEPVANLLVGYKRMHPLRAGMTGRVIAWGRRPWAAWRLGQVFRDL